jgi:hypothetical protein
MPLLWPQPYGEKRREIRPFLFTNHQLKGHLGNGVVMRMPYRERARRRGTISQLCAVPANTHSYRDSAPNEPCARSYLECLVALGDCHGFCAYGLT